MEGGEGQAESLEGWDLDPRNPQHVLSVLQVEGGFLYSLMPAGDRLPLPSPFLPGFGHEGDAAGAG